MKFHMLLYRHFLQSHYSCTYHHVKNWERCISKNVWMNFFFCKKSNTCTLAKVQWFFLQYTFIMSTIISGKYTFLNVLWDSKYSLQCFWMVDICEIRSVNNFKKLSMLVQLQSLACFRSIFRNWYFFYPRFWSCKPRFSLTKDDIVKLFISEIILVMLITNKNKLPDTFLMANALPKT